MTPPSAKDGLRSIQEIHESYRSLFESYPCFNRVQSAVFDNIMHSTHSLVITAPTGAGKTVLFELALVKLLMDSSRPQDIKAVYVAPVKALCAERFQDWSPRFAPLGVSCVEVTGDSIDHTDLMDHQLILTTPEKWDSLTRRWRDNLGLVSIVKLIMIDEVHLLNDPKRGPVLEAIVCRMKTVVKAMKDIEPVRFIAVSATIYNIDDLGEWLGEGSAVCQRFGSEMRPVTLKQVVRGYPLSRGQSPFQFDINLSFKLKSIISEFSEGKPVLIFCSTRRGVVQTCQTLADQLGFKFSPQQTAALSSMSVQVSDNKLRNFMLKGIGYHHAGMITEDRVVTQNAFASSSLPVLVATSTLAMGVNLPAHLVIIKSTHQFLPGSVTEYPETSILQMVGRAGRPQFDDSATAVIMTRQENAKKYENLLDCKEVLESSLHLHLPEHINSEVVLLTIRDLGVAMDWLRCTFLYQRALKNPAHYGLTRGGSVSKIEKELETMLLRELNALQREELVELNDNGMDISPTANGRVMSHYYINFQTFKLFKQVDEKSSLKSLITLLSSAYELSESQLRVNERRVLNELNECKTKATIRFPIKGKIKTRELKVNCLIQACLGCLPITEAPLQQEAIRIVNSMERVVKCLAEYLLPKKCYSSYYSTALLTKCLHARLWEDSRFVARQLDRIGPTLASSLVACGKTSFAAIEQSHPQELEKIVNRKPPLGNKIIEQVRYLPRYHFNASVEKESVLRCVLHVRVEMVNANFVSNQSTAGSHHAVNLIIGDSNNRLLHQRRIADSALLKNSVQSRVVVQAPLPMKIFVHLISEQWVGLDITKDLVINPMAPVIVDFRCHLPPAEVKQKKTTKKKEANDPSVLSYFKKNAPKKDKKESGGPVSESVVIVESNLDGKRTNSPLNADEIQEELGLAENDCSILIDCPLNTNAIQQGFGFAENDYPSLRIDGSLNTDNIQEKPGFVNNDQSHSHLNTDKFQDEVGFVKNSHNPMDQDHYQIEYDPFKNWSVSNEKKIGNNQVSLQHYWAEYDPLKNQKNKYERKMDENQPCMDHDEMEYDPLTNWSMNNDKKIENKSMDPCWNNHDSTKTQNVNYEKKMDYNQLCKDHQRGVDTPTAITNEKKNFTIRSFVPYVCCFDLEPLTEDFFDSEPTILKPLEMNLTAAGPFTADKSVEPKQFSCESNGKKTLSEILKDYSTSSDPILRNKMAAVQRKAATFERTEKEEREAQKVRQPVLGVRPPEETVVQVDDDEPIEEPSEANDALKKTVEIDLDVPEAQRKEYSLLTDGIDFSEELSECKNGDTDLSTDFPTNWTADSPPMVCGLPETKEDERQEPDKHHENCQNLKPFAQASRRRVKSVTFPEQYLRAKNLAEAQCEVSSRELNVQSRNTSREGNQIGPACPQRPLERWNSRRNLNVRDPYKEQDSELWNRSSSIVSSHYEAVVEQNSVLWSSTRHFDTSNYGEPSVASDTHIRSSDRHHNVDRQEQNSGPSDNQRTYGERDNQYMHHNVGTAEQTSRFRNKNSYNLNSETPQDQDTEYSHRNRVPTRSLEQSSEFWNGNRNPANCAQQGSGAFYTPPNHEAYYTEGNDSVVRYNSYSEPSSKQNRDVPVETYYTEEQESEFRYRNSPYTETSVDQNAEGRDVPASSYGEPTADEKNFNGIHSKYNRPSTSFYSTVVDQPKDSLLDMRKSYDLFSSVQDYKTQDYQAKTYQSHDDFFNPVTQEHKEDSQSDYESSLQPKRMKLQEDSEDFPLEPIQSMTVNETDPNDEKLKDEVLNIVETVLDKSYLEEQSLQTSNAEERLELLEMAVVKSVVNPSGILIRSDLSSSKPKSCEKPASGDRLLKRSVEFDGTKLGGSSSFEPAKLSATQPCHSKLNTGLLARNLLGLCPNTFAMSQTAKEKDYSWLKKWSFSSQTENVKKLQPSQVRCPEPPCGPKSLKDYLAAVKNSRSPFLLSQK